MDESYVSIFLKCYNCMKNPENAQVSGNNCNGQRNNKFNKTRKKNIYVGIVNCCLSQICYRVTTLDRRKNLVFASYL